MMRRSSRFATATTHNITVSRSSTTNAQTYDTLPVLSQYRSFPKILPTSSLTMTKRSRHCQHVQKRYSKSRRHGLQHHSGQSTLTPSLSTSFGTTNREGTTSTSKNNDGCKSNGRRRKGSSNKKPTMHRGNSKSSKDFLWNSNEWHKNSYFAINTNSKHKVVWLNWSGKT